MLSYIYFCIIELKLLKHTGKNFTSPKLIKNINLHYFLHEIHHQIHLNLIAFLQHIYTLLRAFVNNILYYTNNRI